MMKFLKLTMLLNACIVPVYLSGVAMAGEGIAGGTANIVFQNKCKANKPVYYSTSCGQPKTLIEANTGGKIILLLSGCKLYTYSSSGARSNAMTFAVDEVKTIQFNEVGGMCISSKPQ